jgi:tetraacyldisaccharide-1-P 4'-kinase
MSDHSTKTLKQQLLQALVQAWNGRSTDAPNVLGQVLVVLLLPISWLFAGAVTIRRELYRRGIYKQETPSPWPW